MTDAPTIRPARPADAAMIADVMGRAFQDDPVSGWLFADPDHRAQTQPSFFRIFVDLTIDSGLALVAEDAAGINGVTLWLDVDPATPDPDDGGALQEQFGAALGAHAERFAVLDELMTASHPHHEAHAYLPFIAVTPDRQGNGVGAALLDARLAELDAAGRPAYLEASSARNAALYERLGFRHLAKTLDLPDGPSLYPMWRPPQGS